MGEDSIIVYGHNLVTEVMGQWTFAELTYAAMTGGTRPSAAQTRMIDVLLTTFVDHGVTPSSLATRLTPAGGARSDARGSRGGVVRCRIALSGYDADGWGDACRGVGG